MSQIGGTVGSQNKTMLWSTKRAQSLISYTDVRIVHVDGINHDLQMEIHRVALAEHGGSQNKSIPMVLQKN